MFLGGGGGLAKNRKFRFLTEKSPRPLVSTDKKALPPPHIKTEGFYFILLDQFCVELVAKIFSKSLLFGGFNGAEIRIKSLEGV